MSYYSLTIQRPLSMKISSITTKWTMTAFRQHAMFVYNYRTAIKSGTQKRFFGNCRTLLSSSSLLLMSNNNSNIFNRCYPDELLSNQSNIIEDNNKRTITTSSTLMMNKKEDLKNDESSSPIIAKDIADGLIYFTNNPKCEIDKNTLKFKEPTVRRPLVVMFAWMSASKSHLIKYVKIYSDLGFDTVVIRITSSQLLWPVKGAQIVAANILKFLEINQDNFEVIIIHGFSVGGYMCGEICVHIKKDMNRYENLLKKFYAQIWDSAADVPEIPNGFPKAVFPSNQLLQKLLRNYIIFHMKIFYDKATVHYMRSSKNFHFNLIKAPALFLVSKNDPIGSEKSNWSVKTDWESIGIECTWKCWDRSGHVLHYKYHTTEYMELIMKHLEKNVFSRISSENDLNKMKAKL